MPFTPLDSQSLYSSAFMSGALPWAVWTAILSSIDADGTTALSPAYLAAIWHLSEDEIRQAWNVHTEPDPKSKNTSHGGRRMIPMEDGRWLVVSYERYREKYRPEFRKEMARIAKQRQRAKEKGIGVTCQCGEWLANPGDPCCPKCAFEEAK